MSQAADSSTEPSAHADSTKSIGQPPHTDPDPRRETSSELSPASDTPQSPDSHSLLQSTEDKSTEGDTVTTKAQASDVLTDQESDAPTEGHVIECDQPVSLENESEAAEEDPEVGVCFFLCFLMMKSIF